MASPKKKSPKRKKPEPMAVPPPEVVEAPPSGQKKGFSRILIAVIALVVIVEAVKFLNNGQSFKPFKVTQILKITGEENPCGHFSAWGAAPVGKDRFIVVDQEDARLMLFDNNYKYLKSWGKNGSGPGEFHEATGMTTDDKGNAYVVDTWNAAIKGFDENGKQILTVNFGNNGFYGPRGIAYDGKNFAIADSGSHRIAILSPQGTMVASWGNGRGKGEDQWDSPLEVVVDSQGNYFATDTGNNRVKKLDPSGKLLKMIKMGDASPVGLALDKEGRLFVAFNGPEASGVKVYGPNGDYQGDLRDDKDSADPFQSPHRLAVLSGDRLLETSGGSFSIFQIPAP